MKTRRLVVAGMVVLGACLVSVCWAQTTARRETTKSEDIRKLMQVTGAGDLGIQVMNQMMHSFKQSFPIVPESFWEDFRNEVNADEMVELVIPIYDKHVSQADIREAIRFYESPAGRRIAKALPLVTQESMQAGEAWGKKIGERVAAKLEAKGYLK